MATLDDYEIIKDLGAGAFSTVKLGKHKDTEKMYALKIIKDDALENTSNLATFKTEVDAMKEINHPNIINLIKHSNEGNLKKANGETKENVTYLTLELAPGGELFDFIAQTGAFSEPVARYYFKQIIDAFEYLHSKGISHRDMKPDNIMLDDEFGLKIADFGFSSKAASNQSFKGTRSYMAPEILIGAKYFGPMVDIFASGIILFIMVTQIPPFQMAHPKDGWYKFVCSNRMDKFWKYHGQNQEGGLDFFSKEFIDLITWIFNFDHTTRPSLSEIKEHDWFKGETATKDEITEEFTKRRELLEGVSDGPVPETNVSQDVYDDRSVHRGVTGELEEGANMPKLQRKEAVYIPGMGGFTKFYSTSPVDDLFACIAQYCIDNTSDYEFSPEEFSVIMTIDDESNNKVRAQVSIQMADDSKHIVEATKLSGDRFQFNDIYKKIKGYYGGHVNAKA
jgi:serine/threonine protein kinase